MSQIQIRESESERLRVRVPLSSLGQLDSRVCAEARDRTWEFRFRVRTRRSGGDSRTGPRAPGLPPDCGQWAWPGAAAERRLRTCGATEYVIQYE